MDSAKASVAVRESVKVDVDEVYISNGETLTVYANGEQIEIRVVNGEVEIFSSYKYEIQEFSEWYTPN